MQKRQRTMALAFPMTSTFFNSPEWVI